MSFPQLFANASVETSAQVSTAAGTPVPPADPISFQTALLVIIAGALIFLGKHISSLSHRLASLEKGKKPRKSSSGSPTTTSNPSAIAPEIVAAISAAVHTTLKGRARILAVGAVCPGRQAWSAEGRRQVFSSHKVR